MKANKKLPQNAPQKAIREFTDREEPRAAFWKNYNLLKEQLAAGEDACDVRVLTYYGIGGIGKSRLTRQLCAEMEEQLASPAYACVNFETAQMQGHHRALESIKNDLICRGRFSFPLFELGLYTYAAKTGEKADSPEVQRLTDKSPALNLILSVADNIPGVSILSKLLSVADQSVALVRNCVNNHRKELQEIEAMEKEELYQYLPTLFVVDMQNNLDEVREPIVILLDTYEKLVNEISQTGDPLKNDQWLREIVPCLSGVLWVIAGREKLKWERFDPDWAEALEQHLLGSLSEADSVRFLEKAGIADEALRRQLYDLSGGTPVYLDLCVDQYENLIEKGLEPTIDLFGKNTGDLVERFLRYMDDAQKDNVYMLACLQSWTDELVLDLARDILPDFSPTAFEKTMGYSFVIRTGDGHMHIHQTMGEVLMEPCPKAIREWTGKALTNRFLPVVEQQDFFSPEYSDALLCAVRGALLLYPERDALFPHLINTLYRPILLMMHAGRHREASPALELLSGVAEQRKTDTFYAHFLHLQTLYCFLGGNFDEAIRCSRSAYALLFSIYGEKDRATLGAMLNLATMLHGAGKISEALPILRDCCISCICILGKDDELTINAMNLRALIMEEESDLPGSLQRKQSALDKSKTALGEDHINTLLAEYSLASTLVFSDRYEEALPLLEKHLDKCNRSLGENHQQTLTVMYLLAFTLYALDREPEALPIAQALLDKRRRLHGEDDPGTISAKDLLADVLSGLGRYQEALPLQREVLDGRRRILGEDDPETIDATRSLAVTLEALDRYQDSLPLLQELLDKRKRILGEDDPKTIDAMEDLADTLDTLGRYREALPLCQEILDKRKRVLGKDHPATAIASKNVSYILNKLGM